MESVVIHGQDTEWEDTKEGVICGSTSCLRYSNIKMIVDKLTMPGCVFDHLFLGTLLLCLPSFSTPLEFFNCLAEQLFPSTPVKNVFVLEQVQTKVLMVLRCWVKDRCAYADMSTGSLLDNMIELMREANKKCAPSIATLARKIKESLKNLREDLRSIDEAQILYRSRVMAVQSVMGQVMIAHSLEQAQKQADAVQGRVGVDSPRQQNVLSSGNSSMNLMEGVVIAQGPSRTQANTLQSRGPSASTSAAADAVSGQYEDGGTIIHNDSGGFESVSTDICSSSPLKSTRMESHDNGDVQEYDPGIPSGSLMPSGSAESVSDLVRVSEGSPDGGTMSALPSNLNFDHSMKSEILISRDSMGNLVTVKDSHLKIISRDSMQMLRNSSDGVGGDTAGCDEENNEEEVGGIDIEDLNISDDSGDEDHENNDDALNRSGRSNHSSHTILHEYMSSSVVDMDIGLKAYEGDSGRGRTLSTSSMASVALDYNSVTSPAGGYDVGSPVRSQLYSIDPGSLHDRRALYGGHTHSVDASPVARAEWQHQLRPEQGRGGPGSAGVGAFPPSPKRDADGIAAPGGLLTGNMAAQLAGSPQRRAGAERSPSRARTDSASSQSRATTPPPQANRFKTRMSYKKLAMLLTIIEYEDALCCIRPREFIGQGWTKKELKAVHPDLGGASILSKFIFNTNQRIAWVAREILNYGLKSSGLSGNAAVAAAAVAAVSSSQSTPLQQQPPAQLFGTKTPGSAAARSAAAGTPLSPPPPPRTPPPAPTPAAFESPGLSSSPKKMDHDHATNDCIEYFLLVARACLKLNNFNTVFQIMSALALPAIKNLKAAWSNISSSKKVLYKSLVELCSTTDNYTNYRMKLAEVMREPKIPCIQVFLRDLTMLENVGEWRKGGFIDLKKVFLMAQMIRNYLPSDAASQGRGYGLDSSPKGKSSPSAFTRYDVEITGAPFVHTSDTRANSTAGRSYSSATNTPQRHSSSSQRGSFCQSLVNSGTVSFLRYLQLSRDSFFEGLHQVAAERNGGAASSVYRRELQWSTASASVPMRTQSNIETTPKKSKISKLFSPLITLFSGDKSKSSKKAGGADESRWHLTGDDMELAILQQYIQWYVLTLVYVCVCYTMVLLLI